jgi:hypothetical protein
VGTEISLGCGGTTIKVQKLEEIDGKRYIEVRPLEPFNSDNIEYLLNIFGKSQRSIIGIIDMEENGRIVGLLVPIDNLDLLFLGTLMATIYASRPVTEAFILVRTMMFGVSGDRGFFKDRIIADVHVPELPQKHALGPEAIDLLIRQAQALINQGADIATVFSQPDPSETLDRIGGHVENCYLKQVVKIRDMKVGDNHPIGSRNWINEGTGEAIYLAIGRVMQEAYVFREMQKSHEPTSTDSSDPKKKSEFKLPGVREIPKVHFVDLDEGDGPRQLRIYLEDPMKKEPQLAQIGTGLRSPRKNK